MNITNIHELPIAANVCQQMLREVTRNEKWSLAHVTMNPEAESLLHVHKKMTEIYVVTSGRADLFVGSGPALKVRAGNVIVIDPGRAHKTVNTGLGTFQHFVLANPPFDPGDVNLLSDLKVEESRRPELPLPPFVECFDGARIIAHSLPDLSVSHAFGFVINDPARHKPVHYHKKITEYVFVVEGKGIFSDGNPIRRIEAGDWIEIPPGQRHALLNYGDQHMVVLCTCTPAFDKDDVFWD